MNDVLIKIVKHLPFIVAIIACINVDETWLTKIVTFIILIPMLQFMSKQLVHIVTSTQAQHIKSKE